MTAAPPPIRVLATRWCGDCRMARAVLDRSGANYEWIDIDHDPQAQAEVLRVNRGMRSVPTIFFADGSVMVEPSRRALTEKLTALSEDVGATPTATPTLAPGAVAGEQCGVDGIPGCDTGPGGRLSFVVRELLDIVRRRPARP